MFPNPTGKVISLSTDNELGSELELEQESLDILAQNVVIKPRRQEIEVELTDSRVCHAADDVLEDEADVSVYGDRNMNQKPLTEDEISMRMTTCEEHDTMITPILRFSFEVGTLTGSPTANDLEKIVMAGHVPHPNQFPCDVAGNKFPISVLNVKKQNGETSSRGWIVFSPTKVAIYCFPCRLFPIKSIFQHIRC
ncbi:Zinc finger MYM-type protein 5-like [Oopsacas minuta]|uniref:Zinc finger MYM-type protein 5-like n=1 Tax=Oopsacas minuta TaxID=111878 RepID=A0AAV7KG18_9METZ|nr:Zinc finger MYM-type protein 5-like [Oopsacas minuta]